MKYVLHPGYVKSISDGDVHYISAQKLAALYGVDFKKCIIYIDSLANKAYPEGDYMHLFPNYNGKYPQQPKPKQE